MKRRSTPPRSRIRLRRRCGKNRAAARRMLALALVSIAWTEDGGRNLRHETSDLAGWVHRKRLGTGRHRNVNLPVRDKIHGRQHAELSSFRGRPRSPPSTVVIRDGLIAPQFTDASVLRARRSIGKFWPARLPQTVGKAPPYRQAGGVGKEAFKKTSPLAGRRPQIADCRPERQGREIWPPGSIGQHSCKRDR